MYPWSRYVLKDTPGRQSNKRKRSKSNQQSNNIMRSKSNQEGKWTRQVKRTGVIDHQILTF